MKLHTEASTIVRATTTQETEFSIKTTAKAFSILSSSLYSDKVLAPIRELSCNAYDAHVAAGKKDVPFEVKLPTALDQTFHVKDYGTGLSHEGVMRLYTTYFDSTKTESDDYIGALGLGSKSPFAYTDRFTVESRFNGMKMLYSAFINERGIPALVKLCEDQPTDELNGLTVSFVVRRGDEFVFADSARSALMFFSPAPTIIGTTSTPYKVEKVAEGTNWYMRNRLSNETRAPAGTFVVQGAVAYPVDRGILQSNGLPADIYVLAGANLTLVVDIGDVDVAPSREALSYTKHTCKTLIALLHLVDAEFRAQIQTSFEKCTCVWDARILFGAYIDSKFGYDTAILVDRLHKAQHFTYDGKELTRSVVVDLSMITDLAITAYHLDSSGRKRPSVTGTWTNTAARSSFTLNVQKGFSVVVNDLPKRGSKAVIDHHMEQLRSGAGDDVRLLVVHPVTHDNKSKLNDLQVAVLLEQFGGVPDIRLSSFGYKVEVAKATTTYKARPKGHCLAFTGFPSYESGRGAASLRRKFSRLTWRTVEVDFSLGGYYMPMERFSPMHNGREAVMLDVILSQAVALGMLPGDGNVFGFSAKDIAAVQGDSTWVNLFEHIEAKMPAMSKTMVAPAALQGIERLLGDTMKAVVNSAAWKVSPARNTAIGKVLQTTDALRASASSASAEISLWDNLVTAMSFSTTKMKLESPNTLVTTFSTQFQAVVHGYPLLSIIHTYHISPSHIASMLDYFVMCDMAAEAAHEELKAA